MPAEAAVEEPAQAFGTSMEDIFNKVMPKSVEDIEGYEPPPAKEEKAPESKFKSIESGVQDPGKEKPEKKEVKEKSEKPVKKEEPKVEQKVEKKDDLLSDLLGDTPAKTEEVVTPAEDEPKKVEAPPEMKGKTRESFEALATKEWENAKKLRAAEKKAAELEAKVQQGDPQSKTLLESKEKQIKDLSDRLGLAGLEHHPWFEQTVLVPRANALGAAQKAFEDAGGDPKALASALRLEGRQRAERLDELMGDIRSDTLKGKIGRAIDIVENLDQRKEYLLQNREQVTKQLRAQDEEQTKKLLSEHEEQVKADLKEASKFLLEKHGLFVFKEIDNPKWKEELKKMDDESEQLMLRTADRKQLSIATRLAVAAPRLWAFLKEERKARLQAEAERDAYRNSEPGVGTKSRKSAKESAEESDEEKPLKSAILESIHAAQGR